MPTTTAPVPRYRTTLKVASLGLMVLLLLIPAAMVRSLVIERQARAATVAEEVGSVWGRSQTLAGPVLTVPYMASRRTVRSGPQGQKAVQVASQGAAHFLPVTIVWSAEMVPEVRSRGIFDVVVYTARLHAEGRFQRPGLDALGLDDAAPRWRQATLSIGISDLRGVRERPRVTWMGASLVPLPGASVGTDIGEGLHVVVPGLADAAPGQPIRFSLDLVLGGSGALMLTPAGDDTTVSAGGPWPTPSFSGAFLPRTREVTAEGFTATWQVPALSRGFPNAWTGTTPAGAGVSRAMRDAAFGVSLVIPADGYQQSERAIKYAILFIGLNFLTFFLLELLGPTRLHPLQYLMVGMALCLFYLLLLALSEHLGFALAYLIAATGVVVLVARYAATVLASRRRALLLASVLTLLYAFLYAVLRCEDDALLIGSVALFGVLAAVMHLTRRLDWYTLEFARGGALPGGTRPLHDGPETSC